MHAFMGYRRSDGRVGIRNHVVLISTTACMNGVLYRLFRSVPGLKLLMHSDGCAGGHGSAYFRRTLLGICGNPNVYAAIVIGLGCEMDNAKDVGAQLAESGKKVFAAISEKNGGGGAVIEEAARAAKHFLREAAALERVPCPLSSLVIGLQDDLFGAAAGEAENRTAGHVSDWLIARGGAVILSETGRLLACKDEMAARAADRDTREAIRDSLDAMERQIDRHVQGRKKSPPFSVNSYEAARICALKGGTSKIKALIDYAEPVGDRSGLLLMDAQGFGTETLTGAFAAGAQVGLFCSSEPNPFGFTCAPVIKIGPNADPDVDIVSGKDGGERCIRLLLEVIEGRTVAAESLRADNTVMIYRRLPAQLRRVDLGGVRLEWAEQLLEKHDA